MAGTASTITCQGQYTETYTDIIIRAVGPTELSGARGTLPVTTPSDANSIWLAVNGNDGTANGTQALPYATVAAAIANASYQAGTIPNLQMFRNGYTGALEWSTTSVTIPSGNTVQVEDGEIAKWTVTGGGRVTVSNTTINGLWIYSAESGNSQGVLRINTGTAVIQNCRIENEFTGYAVGYDSASTGAILTGQYSIFRGSPAYFGPTNSSTSFTNSILLGVTSADDIMSWGNAPANAQTVSFTRCLFGYGATAMNLDPGQTSGANQHTHAFTSCAFVSLAAGFGIAEATTGVTYYYAVTLNYCYFAATATSAITESTGDASLTVTTTNAIDSTLPPLLVNQSDGTVNGDADSLQLQIRGKSTPDGTGRYFITSPLQGAGSGGVDVNPWDETVTGPTRAYASSFTFVLAPASHSIEPEFIGNVEVDELNGGTDQDYDGMRRVWKIEWSAGVDALNNDWKRLQALQRDKSRKKVYLRGVDGNWLDGFATQAVFDDTDTLGGDVDGSFALQNLPTPGTITDNWRNFWLEVTDGSTTYEYWIHSNDGDDTAGSKLYIIDKLGQGFPANGTYDVAIRYFIASIRLEGQPLQFAPHKPGFLEGQRWAEAYDTGSVEPQTDQERYQGKGFALILVEQTDPKAGPS